MAKSDNHVYSINLDVTTSQASKQAFKELQTAYETSNKDMNALNSTYTELVKNTKDATELEKQYNKIIAQRLAEKDKEIDKLNAEKVAIAANTKLTETQKEEMIALVDCNIERLKVDKKYIKAKEKEAKLLAKMNKMFHSNLDENSKAFKLAKSTVAVQEKLNTLLGKESKLRKAASKVAAASVNVGKAGLKAGVKAMGGALAIGGMVAGAAIAGADEAADKERALSSLKSGIDPSIVDSVYIKSGADYGTIVAAVNNLSDVTKDNAQLVQGAVLELQNPGIGKLLLSQNQTDGNNIAKLNNAIAQIKKQTGAQEVSAALEASTKARVVTNGKVSQTDYIQAYSALAQTGLDEEKIDQIIRNVASKKGDFIENLNKADLTRYVQGQDKNRLSNIKLGLEKLDLNKETEKSSAQSIVEKLREFELKKNELLVKMLPVVDKILTEVGKVIDSPVVDKIAQGLVSLFTAVLPLLEPVLSLLQPILDLLTPVVEWFSKLVKDFVGVVLTPLLDGITNAVKRALKWWKNEDEGKEFRSVSGGAHAQGGIITAPSIVGEAGPELVLPLDYSRAGRTASIINNFNTNQSFNMAANQTTPLAFSQAVGNNRFIKRISNY